MTKQELEAKIEDMQRQPDKLFSFHGISWRQIEKQRKDNAPQYAHGVQPPR
jgi:hypothetical protein